MTRSSTDGNNSHGVILFTAKISTSPSCPVIGLLIDYFVSFIFRRSHSKNPMTGRSPPRTRKMPALWLLPVQLAFLTFFLSPISYSRRLVCAQILFTRRRRGLSKMFGIGIKSRFRWIKIGSLPRKYFGTTTLFKPSRQEIVIRDL
jgi:hypothetical protein